MEVNLNLKNFTEEDVDRLLDVAVEERAKSFHTLYPGIKTADIAEYLYGVDLDMIDFIQSKILGQLSFFLESTDVGSDFMYEILLENNCNFNNNTMHDWHMLNSISRLRAKLLIDAKSHGLDELFNKFLQDFIKFLTPNDILTVEQVMDDERVFRKLIGNIVKQLKGDGEDIKEVEIPEMTPADAEDVRMHTHQIEVDGLEYLRENAKKILDTIFEFSELSKLGFELPANYASYTSESS